MHHTSTYSFRTQVGLHASGCGQVHIADPFFPAHVQTRTKLSSSQMSILLFWQVCTFRVWPRTVGGLLRAAGTMMLGQQAVLRRGSRMIVSHLETYECCPVWRCAAGTNKSAPLGASPAGAQANWAPMSDTGAER